MKVYAGAPGAARHYVEVGRARADDYYLAEGTGIARRFTVTDGHVVELAPLTGDGYEAWVAGRDPDTGQPRGRLRDDAHAVRFVEVVVNGPKTWSLAAALHPDIAEAYEGAQDRAAQQIVAWVSQHATTRVGPRGGQIPVPLDVLEAATVAHYTSRAGDPHWHLHLQFNSRVYAAGTWRGLFTVDIRDSLGAINGIGHAAMATDPQLNAALAAHGYSMDPSGEIRQLVNVVGPFSARHTQIARNADRYEREWTSAHPGEHAGPAVRRSWDARAWAEGRPDKVVPVAGADLRGRWRAELSGLGYRDPDRPVDRPVTPIGALDRDQLAARVLCRLGAERSGWNAADIRGVVERLIAEAGIVTDPAVRIELAEDLTARALDQCVRLVHRDGLPAHIRAWTTPAVVAVEADLTGRLAARAAVDAGGAPNNPPTPRADGVTPLDDGVTPLDDEHVTPLGAGVTSLAGQGVIPLPVGVVTPPSPAAVGRLDAVQAAAAAVLAGDRQLVVVEGAAGAGKTTTLAAARDLLAGQGRRMLVVTPTLKAARVAGREIGTATGSAAALSYRYGWRWNGDGKWTRLAAGEASPGTGRVYTRPPAAARLRAGDLLVIDEAGMLDQDTARALLTIADEAGARVALLGDRHQLAAVGRGGVLDHAVRQVDPTGYLVLDGVHRFVRPDLAGALVPDREYARLSLAMRAGADPGAVFDALVARGQLRLHVDEPALHAAVAEAAADVYAAGQRAALIVDTREQIEALNAAVRDRLVQAGLVDGTATATVRAGQPVGEGDLVATRRNNTALGVANRDTWTVTAVHPDGSLSVTPADAEGGSARRAAAPFVSPGVAPVVTPQVGTRVGTRVLPADYVREQVELAYATTAHGVQGDTVTTAHLVIGQHTGAASAYVGMTRGREANTAHLVADGVDGAREQWLAAFAKDKADLGPAHARREAARAAADFAPVPVPAPSPAPPAADGQRLDAVLAELSAAWTEQEDAHFWQRNSEHRLATTEAHAAWYEHSQQILGPLEQRYETARAAKQQAEQAAAGCTDVLAEATGRIADQLRRQWDDQLREAREWARTVAAGPGRLGLHRSRVADATMRLDVWAYTWTDAFPGPYPDLEKVRGYPDGYGAGVPAVNTALYQHAQRLAAAEHPDHAGRLRDVQHARARYDTAADALYGAQRDLREQSWLPTYDTGAAEALPDVRATAIAAQQRAETADRNVARLVDDPAISSQPDPAGVLASAGDRWTHQRDADQAARLFADLARRRAAHPPTPDQAVPYPYTVDVPRGPSIGR